MTELMTLRMAARAALQAMVCAGFLLAGAGAGANEAQKRTGSYELNIPAQDLHAALQALALAAHRKLFYPSDVVAGKTSPPLKGSYTAEEAIRALLAGTDLTFEFTSSSVVLIRPKAAASSGEMGSAAGQMRLAMEAATDKAAKADPQSFQDSQQVVVKGDKDRIAPFTTANIDLTRTEDDVLPFEVFTREEIQRSGAIDLAEFFRNRMSQNFTPGIREQDINVSILSPGSNTGANTANGFNFSNGAGGLGQGGNGELLMLVDGRRLPNRAYGTQSVAVQLGDFRSIPIASIERVEYITSAASAIYGAGATGGVINIITRRDYSGGTAAINLEAPADGNTSARTLELNYALPVGNTLRLRFSSSYRDSNPLTLGDRRELLERYRSHIMQNLPSILTGSTAFPPLGATTNIRSNAGVDLFGAGTPGITSVPAGYTGGQGRVPFDARQGQYNLDISEGGSGLSWGAASYLGSPVETWFHTLAVEKTIGENWRAEFAYQRSETTLSGRGQSSGAPGQRTTVAASAPTNPFLQTVRINYFDSRIDLRPELTSSLKTTQDALSATLRGSLGGWRVVSDFQVTKDTNLSRNLEYAAPLMGWAAAYNTGAYNPFVDMRVVAAASDDFYEQYQQKLLVREGATRNYQATTRISGPLVKVPAGHVQLTAGAEWTSQERYKIHGVDRTTNNLTGERLAELTQNWDLNRSRGEAVSLYGEVTVPVVSDRQRIPLLHAVEVFASARAGREEIASYRIDSVAFTQEMPGFFDVVYAGQLFSYRTDPHVHAYGLAIEPVPDLRLRASRSIGFVPPAYNEVVPNPQATGGSLLSVFDRRRNDAQVFLTTDMFITGGNPQLQPEKTASTNLGVIFRPRWIGGFRMAVDYVSNVRNSAITSLVPQTVLDLELDNPSVAERVQRDGAGNILFIDARYINFLEVLSRSGNLSLHQEFDGIAGGQLALSAAVTKTISYKLQSSASAPSVEQVRKPTSSSTYYFPVQWNGNAQLTWQGDSWGMGWDVRYFDDMLVRTSQLVAQGSSVIPSAVEHGLNVSYETAVAERATLLSGVSFNFGIKNVFDRRPRLDVGNTALGYATPDSVFGRTFWLQVRKSL